jgi:hypothetical protein
MDVQSPTTQEPSLASLFLFVEMLPADRRLLLDPGAHTAILFKGDGAWGDLQFHSFSLTPSAAQLFFTLLQAYPHYCSYHMLFCALYASTPRQDELGRIEDSTLMVLPVRRALKTLLPTLRSLGLQVISLRGQGYVLASVGDVARVEGKVQPQGETKDRGRDIPNQTSNREGRVLPAGVLEARESERT